MDEARSVFGELGNKNSKWLTITQVMKWNKLQGALEVGMTTNDVSCL